MHRHLHVFVHIASHVRVAVYVSMNAITTSHWSHLSFFTG